MPEYVRVGQVADAVDRSPYQIRKLCDAGVIDSIVSEGQRLIPMSELQRLLKEGVPPIPRIIADQHVRHLRRRSNQPRPTRRRNRHQLHTEPSHALVSSGEDVEITENRARTKEAQIREALAELKLLDARDEIAQRNAKRDAERADQLARKTAIGKRQDWSEKWLQVALDMIPEEALQEYVADVYPEVKAKLASLDASDPPVIVETVVASTVRRVLKPWYEEQEILQDVREAISMALKGLPSDMKPHNLVVLGAALAAAYSNSAYCPPETEWEIKARQAAAESIAEAMRTAGKRLSFERMLSAAEAAVARIVAEYQRRENQR